MVMDALANLGLVATGTAAAGLIARYGIQRFSTLVEDGIDRSAEVAEQGIDRSAAVVEDGIEQFFETKLAGQRAEIEARRVASSRIHEKRASVVRELYRRFVQFDRDVRALETRASSEQRRRQATESRNDLETYYAEHRIYFPSETCEVVEALLDAMTHVVNGARDTGSQDGRSEGAAAVRSGLGGRRDVTGADIEELTDTFENHCRALLGVDREGP